MDICRHLRAAFFLALLPHSAAAFEVRPGQKLGEVLCAWAREAGYVGVLADPRIAGLVVANEIAPTTSLEMALSTITSAHAPGLADIRVELFYDFSPQRILRVNEASTPLDCGPLSVPDKSEKSRRLTPEERQRIIDSIQVR